VKLIGTNGCHSGAPTDFTASELPEEGYMDSNRVKGTVDELVGVVKKKTGEMTGSTKLQAEGVVQQAKGKLENALGKAADALKDANEEAAVGSKPVV
jgi:uncharacterized protein YjbJ (UPF0337 family)